MTACPAAPHPELEQKPSGSGLSRWLRVWWVASRPFSFPASIIPVIFGTAAAVASGGAGFKPLPFVLALLGMLLLHGGANALGDACDFVRGLDREALPVSGAVVRRLLSPEAALKGAACMLACGSLIGLFLAWTVTWRILGIGLAGVALAVFYAVRPALKYRALGDLAVFAAFGVLGTLGAWTLQTGTTGWTPVLWSLPLGLLIVGIVHANNWRDIESDTARACRTVASILGDRASAVYYAAVLFLPYLLVAGYVALGRGDASSMPAAALLTWFSLPMAFELLKRGLRRHCPRAPFDFLALDGATARLNLCFGALYIIGFALHAALARLV
jgi:1,4-dihydroxy-2-naphthoate polyprenyltransferase